MGPPSTDRFTQPTTPARTDIGRAAMTRPYLSNYPGYGYQEPQFPGGHLQSSSPMQGVEMGYSPAFMSEASRQQQLQVSPSQQQQQQQAQQQQPFGQYAPSSMLPPVGPQSLYENIPYQQGQTAIEAMSSRFPVPQYMPEAEHAGATLASAGTQYMTSQAEQSGYGHVAVSRASLPQSYAPGAVDFPMAEQQEAEDSAAASGVQEALDEGLRDYRRQIRTIFSAIVAGRVTAASEKLLAVSRWLVNSVTALGKFDSRFRLETSTKGSVGLHHDDEAKHAERIELWQEFNVAWEALGQKQREITEEALRTRRQPADILSSETINSLMDDLVGMCDQLEAYGLVDFEMGIWEEQITHIFIICLDLLPASDPRPSTSGTTS